MQTVYLLSAVDLYIMGTEHVVLSVRSRRRDGDSTNCVHPGLSIFARDRVLGCWLSILCKKAP